MVGLLCLWEDTGGEMTRKPTQEHALYKAVAVTTLFVFGGIAVDMMV